MKIFFGKQSLPEGVVSYHLLPTLTLMFDATEKRDYAGGYAYSLTASWLIWGATLCF